MPCLKPLQLPVSWPSDRARDLQVGLLACMWLRVFQASSHHLCLIGKTFTAQGTPHLPPAGLEDALYYAALSDSKTPGSGAVIVTAGTHCNRLCSTRGLQQ